MDWAVVRERKRNHCRFHILPADQYWQEREEGAWTHYSFESGRFFNNLEEAEDYVEWENDLYILFYCTKPGFMGWDICRYDDAENVLNQPSIYKIGYRGTLEECQKFLGELEKEEVEA